MASANQAPYKELTVWQTGKELALAVFQATKDLPEQESTLTQQLRQLALHIPAAIAAGHDNRFAPGTFEAALHDARESALSLELLVEIALDLGFFQEQADELKHQLDNLGKLTFGMLKKLREKQQETTR